MQLVREGFGEKSTEGKLFVNGTFECYTLEDKDRKLEDGGEKVYGKTAIPRGKYNVITSYSNRFKKILPLIEDVPGFTGVRIHPGNTSEDTEGCILVGQNNDSDTDDFIGSSRLAFVVLRDKLLQALMSDEEVTLEIV